jgi:hypothetical protein
MVKSQTQKETKLKLNKAKINFSRSAASTDCLQWVLFGLQWKDFPLPWSFEKSDEVTALLLVSFQDDLAEELEFSFLIALGENRDHL